MSDSQDDFSPELVDQQIDSPDAFLSPAEARLVHRMRAMLELEQRAVIERSWERLTHQCIHTPQPAEIRDLSTERQRNERNSTVNNRNTLASVAQPEGTKSWAHKLGLLAAVLVCLALVGSLTLTLTLISSRSRLATTITGNSGAQNTLQSPATRAVCQASDDQADETLCARGKETILNITENFTATIYDQNTGTIVGPATINVTFHRAYADTSRLFLAYTINQAPANPAEWGNFISLTTKLGTLQATVTLGAKRSTTSNGFFTQSFDTSKLPAGTTQIQLQSLTAAYIPTAHHSSVPLAVTLPLHTESKTVTVKQTATGQGYTVTLDHVVLTDSTATFFLEVAVPSLPKPNTQLMMIFTSNQFQMVGRYHSTTTSENENVSYEQSLLLNLPVTWKLTVTLQLGQPGGVSTLLTKTFTFPITA